MKVTYAILLVFISLAGYLFFWPTPIDPLPYYPPEPPELTGVLAPNTTLRNAEHIGTGKLNGPEDMAVGVDGVVYAADHDGKIMRVFPNGDVDVFAETGGRPLGMMFDKGGNLIVADAWKGLLSVNTSGEVETLTTKSDGIPFRFTDDLDIAEDGTIYFSDASYKYHQPDYLLDLLEARPNGRLLRYNPSTKVTETLLDSLYFANGVAISNDQDFVLVNETYRYQISRYWLNGPKAGTSEIFIENLPGFPDNISATEDGRFWVAVFTVRNPLMDWLHPSSTLKKIMSRLPKFMWPKPAPYGFVIELDKNGTILSSLHDPGGEHMRIITSVKEQDGKLFMGSLYNDRIGVLKLNK